MPTPAALTAALLTWYDRSARVLPWRSDPTPYKVLLSELMLQQTRVETVIPYFARFLERWPTLDALAAAAEEEVVHAWSGLGYYSRARNLHRAAREAVAAGGLPSDPEGLRALPGIGPYTAGAIASIAFGRRVPAVDGNVERVIARLDGLQEDPRGPAARRAIRDRADALVPADRPGDVVQALMELGATVCTPRAPSCGACPWEASCVGRASGDPEALPRKAPRRPPVPVRGVAGLLVEDGRVLLAQRPGRGLLAGLWEPVGAELSAEGEATTALVAAFRERAGLSVRCVRPVGTVVHVFSHRRLSLEVHEVRRDGGSPTPGGGYQALRFLPPRTAGGAVALSTLARKTLALLDDLQPSLPLAADGP